MKGVLLDVDGTLVLSNDAHAHSWVEAFAHYNYSVKFQDVRWLIGMGGDKLIPRLRPELNGDSGVGAKISTYRSQLFLDKYAPSLQATPGARKFIQKLHRVGLKFIIATSAQSKELKLILKSAGLDDLLQQATTADDADNSKPEPDIVHAALDKLGLNAAQVMMIGDTPYDIEAAGRAGVQLIALRCGGWQDKDLQGAAAIYDDPADLLATFKSSPLKCD